MSRREIPEQERFASKYIEASCGCHIWLAATNSYGYGNFRARDLSGEWRNTPAHRFAWERANGKIPDGLHIDHRVCRVKACVNPAHMALCTPAENILQPDGGAAKQKSKTHCYRGHPLTGENLAYRHGWRVCKACRRQQRRASYRRHYVAIPRKVRTHCPHGHPIIDGNIYMDGKNARCRTCILSRSAAYRKRKKLSCG